MFDLHAYAGKRIVVTGSSGYLANQLIHKLCQQRCHITRVASSGAVLSLVQGECELDDVIGDLTSLVFWEPILPAADIVFHFAGRANIALANQDPLDDLHYNVLPLLTLLEACKRYGRKPTIILASTVSVYGASQTLPVTEQTHIEPRSIYDLHKWQSEHYLRYYVELGWVHGVALRLANVYGPDVRPGSQAYGVINRFITQALRDEPISLYEPGTAKRDYIYVDDLAHAFLQAGVLGDKLAGQVLNVASGQAYSTEIIAEKVKMHVGELIGRAPVIERLPAPIAAQTGTTRHLSVDISAITRALGWQPQVDIDTGIALTLAALR